MHPSLGARVLANTDRITSTEMPVVQLRPATIEEDLSRDVSALLSETYRYRQRDDPAIARLMWRADKLQNADAAAAMRLKTVLEVCRGDYDQAMYWVRNIERLKRHDVHLAALCTVLINFGYFAESQAHFARLMDTTENGAMHLHLGVPNGAFKRYLTSLDASRMRANIHLSNEAQIRDVVSIMDANGDSDEDLGRVMDIAGGILRERKLVYMGNAHQLRPVVEPVDGGHPYFGMHIVVDVSAGEAFEMTCDYADRLAASQLKIPMSLVLSFKSEDTDAE